GACRPPAGGGGTGTGWGGGGKGGDATIGGGAAGPCVCGWATTPELLSSAGPTGATAGCATEASGVDDPGSGSRISSASTSSGSRVGTSSTGGRETRSRGDGGLGGRDGTGLEGRPGGATRGLDE